MVLLPVMSSFFCLMIERMKEREKGGWAQKKACCHCRKWAQLVHFLFKEGAGEITQWWRILCSFGESVCHSQHPFWVAHNCLWLQPTPRYLMLSLAFMCTFPSPTCRIPNKIKTNLLKSKRKGRIIERRKESKKKGQERKEKKKKKGFRSTLKFAMNKWTLWWQLFNLCDKRRGRGSGRGDEERVGGKERKTETHTETDKQEETYKRDREDFSCWFLKYFTVTGKWLQEALNMWTLTGYMVLKYLKEMFYGY